MKIAIIINTSWNIYNFRRGLLKHFLKRGDQVVAIAPQDDYSAKLEQMGCVFYDVPMKASGMNPITDSELIFRLFRILKSEKPDVVLTYTIKPNIYGSLVAGMMGIPCICNVSGLGTVFLWKGYVKRIATTLYSFAFRFNSWVFFQNDEDQREFINYVRLRREKTSLLPGSGIDTVHFQPLAKAPNPTTVFLMISRLLIDKGIYDFIEAACILKRKSIKASFHVIGGLDAEHSRSIRREELDSWISEGLIKYTAHAEDVRQYISESDVVVLPSYREGTPRTLLEAGAMGKAMIATDVPGCRHVVIDGKNGFLCKLKKPNDLASKMLLYMALSDEEKIEMSQNARKSIVDRFDQQLVIDQYSNKIDELLAVKRK